MRIDYEGLRAQLGYAQREYDRAVERLRQMTKHRDEWREYGKLTDELRRPYELADVLPMPDDRLEWETK